MPKAPTYDKLFSTYLSQIVDEHIEEQHLDCPFDDCLKEEHFKVNIHTSLWHCVRCDRGGNAPKLLTFLHQQYLDQTTEEQYKFLQRMRGIAWDIFADAQFAYDIDNDRWLVPYFTYSPDLGDFSQWLNNLGYFYPSAQEGPFVIKKAGGLPTYLYNPGLHQYAPVGKNAIILEGEWDTLAYYDCFRDSEDFILGKPGSGFPAACLETIKECDTTTLILDNDMSGRRQTAGAIKVLLDNGRKRIKQIDWLLVPNALKDIRDHWTQAHTTMQEDISNAIVPYSNEPNSTELTEQPKTLSAGYVEDATQFPLITSFGNYIERLQEINLYSQTQVNAIGAIHGITNSISIPGRPLWGFFKGPGSSGKNEILESFGGTNQWFDNLSRLSSENLVSGWVDDNPDSASYLGRLFGKTLIVKDLTPNLTGDVAARTKLFGLLTDIYDGTIKIHFGNRREEEYHGINFNLIAGVTDILDAHSSASIGERFLRIDWLGTEFSPREYLTRAFQNFGMTDENKRKLTALTLGFVSHLRSLPIDLTLDPVYRESICDLAEFVAILRTKVESNRFEGLIYRPRPELPMRVGLQLLKLHTSCRVVTGSAETAFAITRKVALDTCYGFPLDIVQFIVDNPRSTREEVAEGVNLHSMRAYRVLEDLVTTGVLSNVEITAVRSKGRPRKYYAVNPRLLPALRPDKFDPLISKIPEQYLTSTTHIRRLPLSTPPEVIIQNENQYSGGQQSSNSNRGLRPRRSRPPQ
jgi:predicted transcriptional regulator